MDERELIVVSCPSCTQRFRVRRQSAGRAVKCPHCAQAVSVPVSTSSTAHSEATSQERFQLGPPPQPTSPAAPASNVSTSPTAELSMPASSTPMPAAAPAFDPAAIQAAPQSPQPQASQPQASQPQASQPQRPAEPDPNPFQASALEFAPTSVGGLPIKRRYPALQIIRVIYLVMACFVLVGWAIYMATTLVIAARVGAVGVWFFASLIPTASAAAAATVMVAVAELIKLALDVQSNTLATARNTSNRSH